MQMLYKHRHVLVDLRRKPKHYKGWTQLGGFEYALQDAKGVAAAFEKRLPH